MTPNDPPLDAAGSLILAASFTDFFRVIVLQPTANGMRDFGTLPGPEPGTDARFWVASAYDVDGVVEVVVREGVIGTDQHSPVTFRTFRLIDDDFGSSR